MQPSYESKKLLEEYLLLHYGNEEHILPYSFGPKDALGFPLRAVSETFKFDSLVDKRRALDLGCAVGRSTFELSLHFEQVLGIDFSSNFIDAARRISKDGEIDYRYLVEGEISASGKAKRPSKCNPERISFEVGNACELRPDIGSFDAVLLANLICRVPEPMKLIESLPSLLNPGGQLVITSPYTWLEDHTPKDNWLGGFDNEAGSVRSLDALKGHLEKDFQLEEIKELPFMIREHERKYQWSVAQATIWKRLT